MQKHDCYEHLSVNEDSDGSGYEDYLICDICGETYESDRYICWVRPFPHLSDKIIEKIIDFLGSDFVNDEYGEVEVHNDVILTYPEFYNNKENENIFHRGNSICGREYAECQSKGSYFYEFSDTETYEFLEKRLEKVNRYCKGWCQNN